MFQTLFRINSAVTTDLDCWSLLSQLVSPLLHMVQGSGFGKAPTFQSVLNFQCNSTGLLVKDSNSTVFLKCSILPTNDIYVLPCPFGFVVLGVDMKHVFGPG